MSREPHARRGQTASLLLLLTPLLTACSGDAGKAPEEPAPKVADTGSDAGPAFAMPAGKHVGAALRDFVGDLSGSGAYLRHFAPGDEFTGPAAQAREGDWIIGNAMVRFAVQGPDRHASVCPWGGTLIDAAVRMEQGGEGAWSDDNVGEYCLFFNVGRTLRPEYFEVLRDGKEGGPAVLAVTGPDTLDDFLNLPGMVGSFLGGAELDLGLDVEQDPPLTITRYYIVAPTERVVRVVTAFRNDGDQEVVLGTGELIDSGGRVEFFNPAGQYKGFGYGGITPEPLDYLAFRGDASSHAFAPPPIGGKPGAGYLAVSGVAASMLGTDNVLSTLVGGPEKFRQSAAAVHIQPGAIAVRMHLVAVGSGALSTLSEPIWKARGVPTAPIAGRVVDDKGKPIAGARISAVRGGRARTQFVSDDKGEFQGVLPYGAGDRWSLEGWVPGRRMSRAGVLVMPPATPQEALPVEVEFTATATLSVDVADGGGKPVPAKITVYCAGKCPQRPRRWYDTGMRGGGGGSYLVEFAGMDGHLELPVAPGAYRVLVTGGPSRTLWPDSGKPHPLEVAAGETASVKAVLREAVDTSGWLCGEFHIHQINSPDAPVLNRTRVRSFLAEGVDVAVPTDHDYITDLSSVIAAEKAGERLVSLPGEELTTFDYGHFNAFPLKVDAGDLTGGAIDWAGGAGPGLAPAEIAAALREQGAGKDTVVQINHPAYGYLRAIRADVLGGVSYAPRGPFRIAPKAPDPKSGDTGLFSEDFTAMELMTGHRGGGMGGDTFPTIANWWFALLSRGVRWTGTAVSDSHRAFTGQAGGPRTWVRMPPGMDTIATFDAAAFATAVNAGRATGADGPFVRMWAEAPGGAKARIGEVLAVPAGRAVTLTVDVQAPTWMDLSAVDLYLNPTRTAPLPGESNDTMPPPFATASITPGAPVREAGVDPKARRWHVRRTFAVPVAADGYVVAIVQGSKPMPRALVAGRTVTPFAFTNPIYLDADGGGYDHPPLKKTIQPLPDGPPPPPRKATLRDIIGVIRALEGHSH